MEEMQNLSEQIDFDNLILYFKNESAPKKIVGFKGPLKFNKNIREGNITLEEAEEEQRQFKSEINK